MRRRKLSEKWRSDHSIGVAASDRLRPLDYPGYHRPLVCGRRSRPQRDPLSAGVSGSQAGATSVTFLGVARDGATRELPTPTVRDR